MSKNPGITPGRRVLRGQNRVYPVKLTRGHHWEEKKHAYWGSRRPGRTSKLKKSYKVGHKLAENSGIYPGRG